jgi:hypothetical protein
MCKIKLLALRLDSLLLGTRASYQLFATYNLIASPVARDNQALPRCHYYRQMIHTIPNSVKLFLKNNRQHRLKVANTWNTDSALWKITYRSPREVPGISAIKRSGKPVYAASKADLKQMRCDSEIFRRDADARAYEPK